MSSWQALAEELARWRESGRVPDFWWRDDDAGSGTPALERLLALSHESRVPLALAVIPALADADLLAGLDPAVAVLQHGTDHVNRSAAGEKKNEFPESESAAAAIDRLVRSRDVLAGHAKNFIPVLAPPWNRLSAQIVPGLAAAGYRGLSQYGARKKPEPAPGLKQVNTHVDLIAWQSGRSFVGEEAALDLVTNHLVGRRSGKYDAGEPTGLLSHHACHDEGAWRFLKRLFAFARDAGARWRAAAELFR